MTTKQLKELVKSGYAKVKTFGDDTFLRGKIVGMEICGNKITYFVLPAGANWYFHVSIEIKEVK